MNAHTLYAIACDRTAEETNGRITEGLDHLRAKIEAHEREAAELKTAGLTYAGTWMKAGKYLYLVYPSQDGDRRREYIGADPEAQQAALDGIRRADRYDRTMRIIQRLKERLAEAERYLDTALRILTSERGW